MDILMFPMGSYGDVNPMIGLGLALKGRGHRVIFFANEYYRPLVERCGLEFAEHGSADEFVEAAKDPNLWHPRLGFRTVMERGVMPAMRFQYEEIRKRYEPGKTLVMSSLLGFGTRIASEKLGVPVITVHLQPAVFWSEHESPQLARLLVGPGVPRWLKRFQYWLARVLFINPAACPETNRFRAELGLAPIRDAAAWWHSPDGVLCLFPAWYAAKQPDWPGNVWLTQFPLWDQADVAPELPELEGFMAGGERPIVFTAGSWNFHAQRFFKTAVETCGVLRCRGVMLSPDRGQLPAELPANVRYFRYVPFSRVFPRAAAVVHHGGVGTTAQVLRAGVPQLVVPLSHDQPDNAVRVKRLGAGDWSGMWGFRANRVGRLLERLIDSAGVRMACREVAGRFAGVEPLKEACGVVERFMESRSRRSVG